VKYPGPTTPSPEGKLQEGIERTVNKSDQFGDLSKFRERGATYGLVVKLAESMQYFRDYGRPCRYIFSLSIGLEFCVVLQNAQAEAARGYTKVIEGYMGQEMRDICVRE